MSYSLEDLMNSIRTYKLKPCICPTMYESKKRKTKDELLKIIEECKIPIIPLTKTKKKNTKMAQQIKRKMTKQQKKINKMAQAFEEEQQEEPKEEKKTTLADIYKIYAEEDKAKEQKRKDERLKFINDKLEGIREDLLKYMENNDVENYNNVDRVRKFLEKEKENLMKGAGRKKIKMK